MKNRQRTILLIRKDDLSSASFKKKPNPIKFASELATWLYELGHRVFVPTDLPIKNISTLGDSEIGKVDLVIVLGGDGTYLDAVRRLRGRDIPVLGANFGQIGFLAEIEIQQLQAKLLKVFASKIKPVNRLLLQVNVLDQKQKIIFDGLSLNDVVVERGPNTHLIELEWNCDGSLVSRIRADGVIVSTSLGSTAYNLSAGGPIVHPEVAALTVTPVCPHSLSARPLVLADHHIINVRLMRKQQAILMVDGVYALALTNQMNVVIKKSRFVHKIYPSDMDYFELINHKLDFGYRG